ncbi:PspC domain-containing protein [Hufsiella ginkgonis]|uniref:PspC domain-containing protein n=1 Tax=Hufsiella ginkgonis TaxID=2695274 RepID=A0A7K1XV28_9SPHI|nr:PspC domain-containing protein [Hufsiella ginkgonis]MXV14356.1 PspC domain-containing protein [Hufsiella ginkgonis]
MNKTIIINMNGIIFHIEEDAYDSLKNYMAAIKRHFAYTADSEEIVTDIESRIAEMFSELLEAEKKQVVVLKDVESIVAQMGSVSDFESAEDSPAQEEIYVKPSRKLFKDPDHRLIGGVCSGIAHYFGIDVKWVRLIFLLLLLPGGSGMLIYIIFAIVMPKANTRAERMEMKGEPVTLHNFKKNFDEEAGSGRQLHEFRSKGVIAEFFTFLEKFFGGTLKILVKLVSLFIIITGSIALLSVFVMLFMLMGFASNPNPDIAPFVAAINPEYQSPLYFSAFVLTGIPLVALVLFAVRVLTNYKVLTRTGSFAMLIIWLTGLGTGLYYGTRLAAEFSDEATFTEQIDVAPFPVYHLKLDDSRIITHEDSVAYNMDKHPRRRIVIGHRNIEIPEVRLFIERTDEISVPTLTEKFESRGYDFENALNNARQITYRFKQTGSVLEFGVGGLTGKRARWRGQEVTLTLRVPKNTRLIIDGNLEWYLRNYSLWECMPEGSSYQTPTEWIMTDKGMKCANDSLATDNEQEDDEQ